VTNRFRYLNVWILNFDLPTDFPVILTHPFKRYLLWCLGMCHSLHMTFSPCSYSIYPFCNQFFIAASYISVTKLLNSQTGSAALCIYGFYVKHERASVQLIFLMLFCDMAETCNKVVLNIPSSTWMNLMTQNVLEEANYFKYGKLCFQIKKTNPLVWTRK
jgi:hypothetical protein